MARSVLTEDELIEVLNRRLRAKPECQGAEIVQLNEISGTPNWFIGRMRFENGTDAECQRMVLLIGEDLAAHFDVLWPDV